MLLMHYKNYDFASRLVAKYARVNDNSFSVLSVRIPLFKLPPSTSLPSHGAFHFFAPSKHLPLANAGHASAIFEFVLRQYVAPALFCVVRTPLTAYQSGQRSYRIARAVAAGGHLAVH